MLQLTQPPASTRLTTPDAAATDLGISYDLRLGSLIDQASAACVSFCGRPFASASWRETFRGLSGPLVLSRIPVTAIASVQTGAYELETEGWWLDADAGLVHRHTHDTMMEWHCHLTTVVSYTAGYALPGDADPTLPAAVERACLDMVRTLWFTTGSGGRDPTVRSEAVQGVGSTTYMDPQPGAFGLPASAVGYLMQFRNLRA